MDDILQVGSGYAIPDAYSGLWNHFLQCYSQCLGIDMEGYTSWPLILTCGEKENYPGHTNSQTSSPLKIKANSPMNHQESGQVDSQPRNGGNFQVNHDGNVVGNGYMIGHRASDDAAPSVVSTGPSLYRRLQHVPMTDTHTPSTTGRSSIQNHIHANMQSEGNMGNMFRYLPNVGWCIQHPNPVSLSDQNAGAGVLGHSSRQTVHSWPRPNTTIHHDPTQPYPSSRVHGQSQLPNPFETLNGVSSSMKMGYAQFTMLFMDGTRVVIEAPPHGHSSLSSSGSSYTTGYATSFTAISFLSLLCFY
jgi:hypothetical protein